MTSGKNLRLLLPILVLALPTLAADLTSPVLEEVLYRNTQPLQVRYKEEKNLEILNQSLTSRGRLRFIPPDTLEREVDSQRDRIYRIEGNRIIISEAGRVLHQLELWDSPELAGFATTLRALLAADVDSLRNQYELTLTGSDDSWFLQLVPRGKPLSRIIDRISIEGDKEGIREVITYEQGGNHTRMVLLPDE